MIAEEDEHEGSRKLEYRAAYIKKEISQITESLEREVEKLRDPVVHAALMHAVVTEKENTNRILKNIYNELDRIAAIEERVARIEEEMKTLSAPPAGQQEEVMIPEIDAQIIDFVKSMGKACAEDVQKKFDYKGKNAASARLNRLYSIGLLEKKQAGRRVLYYLH